MTETIDHAAKRVFDVMRLKYAGKYENPPEWVVGGNSLKQDEARDYARAAIPEGYVLVPVEPADIAVVDSFTGRFGVSVGGQEVKYLYDGKPHAGPVNFTFKADAERAAFIPQQAVKMVISAAQQPIGGE